MSVERARLGEFNLLPSWGLGRDEWYTFEGGGAIVMHPLAVAQVKAELAGVERGRPDLDVWLDEMVAAVSRRAAERAAAYVPSSAVMTLEHVDASEFRAAAAAASAGISEGLSAFGILAAEAMEQARQVADLWSSAFAQFAQFAPLRVRRRDRVLALARRVLRRRPRIESPSWRGFTASREIVDEMRGEPFRRHFLGEWGSGA